MIKKEYRRTRKLAYPKIKTLWISEILFVNNTRLEMQNRTNNKDEIILLINPITIKGEMIHMRKMREINSERINHQDLRPTMINL